MRPSQPFVGADQAESWARERFGIEATATELPGEIDRNFLLTTGNGARFVLKIAPSGVDRASLECQLAALHHLGGSDLRDRIPRVVPNLAGESLTKLAGSDGSPLIARILTYLDGRPMERLDQATDTLYHQLGRLLGQLDRSLETFDHPGARRRLVWDLKRLADLRPLCDLVDAGLRPLVVDRLDAFAERVLPRLAELRESVIHNDANDHNILVREGEGGQLEIAGLIDFGDIVRTITVSELAIGCAYAMLDAAEPSAVAAQVTVGYEEAFPLDDLERELLPDLVGGRLCASLLLSTQARASDPGNEYLRISEQPVANLLRKLSMKRTQPSSRTAETAGRSAEELVSIRQRHLGKNLSISYRRPLKIVRGRGQYLYDDTGRRYLDLVNNVCHVGHCHPRVVEAGQRQMELLNTNTRYLHDALAEYLLRLTATMPAPLSVCFLVCTGTEANDLALRLARAHTGSREIVVLDHAYHGHSPALVEISPYKCEGAGGQGLAPYAHKVPCPDSYRGRHRGPGAGELYVEEVRAAIAGIEQSGARLGALMAETLVGCGGQIVPPPGFLAESCAAIREAGGVYIADEVQVGFGRVGSHLWAFEAHGVVPDIVTLGKPIGNGHPLAAVVTTPEIAASFDTGMEYFNTFGGNPVSCAIGLAVLDVIESEGLQGNALAMGRRLKSGLAELAGRHALIGDVRGQGLFLGVELVLDRQRLEPAGREAGEVIERMKDRGFLLSTDGPDHNVIKIKPPMVLGHDDIDATVGALDEVMSEVG